VQADDLDVIRDMLRQLWAVRDRLLSVAAGQVTPGIATLEDALHKLEDDIAFTSAKRANRIPE
jgi:hypothetical protein